MAGRDSSEEALKFVFSEDEGCFEEAPSALFSSEANGGVVAAGLAICLAAGPVPEAWGLLWVPVAMSDLTAGRFVNDRGVAGSSADRLCRGWGGGVFPHGWIRKRVDMTPVTKRTIPDTKYGHRLLFPGEVLTSL